MCANATIHPLVNAIALSTMMYSARAIQARVRELVELLEKFDENFNSSSILFDVRRAGVEAGSAKNMRSTAAHLLHDFRGLQWPLEVFLLAVDSEISEEDAGVFPNR